MEAYPVKIDEPLKVISLTPGVVIFDRINGDKYRAEYMVQGEWTLEENDILWVKNVNLNNGSTSCERVTPGKSDGCVCMLLNPVRIIPT